MPCEPESPQNSNRKLPSCGGNLLLGIGSCPARGDFRLKRTHSGIKNQLGKLTDNPALGWVFQCFQSVHLLRVNQTKQISNLTDEGLWILRFFPAFCRRYYLLV